MTAARSPGSLFRNLFGRAAAPERAFAAAEAEAMIAELASRLPPDAPPALRDAHNLIALAEKDRAPALAAWYAQVEDALAARAADALALRAAVREECARRWPQLAAAAELSLAWTPPAELQLTLMRTFLREAWRGARDVLGAPEGGKLNALGRWLDAGLDAGEASPFSAASPAAPLAAAAAASRGLYIWLEQSLGRRADAIYEAAYQATARRFGAVDEFPAVLGLMPEKLINADKLSLLRRSQIEAALQEKIAALEQANVDIASAKQRAEVALIDLEAAQKNLIHAEKMASLGQMTAGIAHEIKNPLNFVNNFAGLSVELLDELKAALDADKRGEVEDLLALITGNLEKVVQHGKRADGIVKSMLAHSRGGGAERQAADLNAIVEEALNLAYHGARATDPGLNVALQRDYDAALRPIELLAQDIARVFVNLFANGLYAANRRKRDNGDPAFEPTLTATTRDLGDWAEVRIRDNGAGMAPEVVNKLFQPFFTTKPTGEGTGLGLWISYEIVVGQHGGAISVDSRPGEFSEFTVRLPRRKREAAPTW